MTISDISLTAGIRSAMQSHNDTDSKLTKVHERLATGRKVNSALDDPREFFAAMQLKQYADDLSQLHDGIRETIQTVKAATDGITGISQLLQNMRAMVESAKNASDPDAKARYAAAYDELYAQVNYLASDSSYRGANLIGDKDPSLLRWQADDLLVNLSPSGSSQYNVPGKFLGSGYALYEDGAPDIGWVPDDKGEQIYPCTADTTTLPVGSPSTMPSKLDYVFVIDSTGSMAAYIGQVQDNVSAFIKNLQAAGVDGQYAFAKYGDINATDGGDPAVMAPPTFYSDSTAFAAALSASADSGGGGDGPESGLEGILTALSGLAFRADATKRMLLITDVTVHTTSDGKSADTIAGTAATLTAAGVRLDIAAPMEGWIQSQLAPLAAATGGEYFNLDDPAFYTGGFGVGVPSAGVATPDLEIKSADYEKGKFSILFNNPPPPALKSMTAEKAGLNLYHSWMYGGFQTTAGIEAAEKDISFAMEVVRVEAARLGSGSSILTLRDTFLADSAEVSTAGAENLTAADLNEEGANALMLQTRVSLSVTSLGISSKSADSVLKLF